MAICAFFGHRSFDYEPYKNDIMAIIVDLIENHGVTSFYSGARGSFDGTCAHIVKQLKAKYPNVKIVQVLSYRPEKQFEIGINYDETVYLLEQRVPWKYAILHTNRELVKIADYIISGVFRTYGGAYKACKYAEHLGKDVFYVELEHFENEIHRMIENPTANSEEINKIREEKKRLLEKIAKEFGHKDTE